MGKAASIKKNFLYSSILTTAGYIFPLITYPYISRILEVTNIGAVNFVDSLINYFVLFSMLGLSTSGIREIAASRDNKVLRNEIFSSLLTLNILTTLLALIVLIVCMYTVHGLKEYRDLLWIGALKLTFNLFLIEWFYKGMEAFKFITQRTIIVRCLYVIGVFLFIKEECDRDLYYLLTTLSIVINAIINLIYSCKYVNFSLSKIKIAKYWKSFSGMGLYLIFTSLYTTFNITYLGFICGDTQVGYYTTATKIYSILLGFFTAFTGVMLPRMSSLLSEGKIDEFKSKIEISFHSIISFCIPVIICGIFISPQLVYWIAGEGYEGAILPMRITLPLILIIGLEQVLVLQILIPMKADTAVIRNSIAGAVLAIILNILIVGKLQSVGSAIIWFTCEMLLLLLSQYAVWKSIKIILPLKLLVKVVFLSTPLAVVLWIVNNVIKNNLIFYPCIAIIFTGLYLGYLSIFILKNPVAKLLWGTFSIKIIGWFRR